MNGYDAKNNFSERNMPKKINSVSKRPINSLEQLSREVRMRGNRLEIMNGKIYEVKRTLLGEIE